MPYTPTSDLEEEKLTFRLTVAAMITGILAAYPTCGFFDEVMLGLQSIADMPVSETLCMGDPCLPQVHALNCLKDIFSDARFGSSSELHAAKVLDIAARCLEHRM